MDKLPITLLIKGSDFTIPTYNDFNRNEKYLWTVYVNGVKLRDFEGASDRKGSGIYVDLKCESNQHNVVTIAPINDNFHIGWARAFGWSSENKKDSEKLISIITDTDYGFFENYENPIGKNFKKDQYTGCINLTPESCYNLIK